MTTRDTQFKALAVGNACFPEDPRLTPLKGPLNDVDAVCQALSSPDTGLFRCQEPVKDESAQRVKEITEDFFNAAGGNDCLLFYYSGHGRVDRDNEFYLCAKDTNTQNDASPRITGVELAKFVRHSPALLKIIILDCCYANEFPLKGDDVWTPQYFTGKGRFVLAATRGVGSPRVPDAPSAGALSPFTAALVEALRREDLDTDNDGYVTARDVAAYIAEQAKGKPDVPFALEQWVGTGIVPIARSRAGRGVPVVVVEHVPAAPDAIEFPVAVPPGPLPDVVATPEGIRLSRHLVTNGQFRGFLLDPANAQWRPKSVRRVDADATYLRHWDDLTFDRAIEHHPVVNVSAGAASAYASWAGRQVGKALRLPRVDEWKRAAAAGRAGDWPEEDIAAGRVNFRRTLARLSDVGEFQVNPYGFADLLGNAWEICLDHAGLPVLCGGAFDTPQDRLLEELTLASLTQCRADTGFRCAC